MEQIELHIAAQQADQDSICLVTLLAHRHTYEIATEIESDVWERIMAEGVSRTDLGRQTVAERLGKGCYKHVPGFFGLVYFHNGILPMDTRFDHDYIKANVDWADVSVVNP